EARFINMAEHIDVILPFFGISKQAVVGHQHGPRDVGRHGATRQAHGLFGAQAEATNLLLQYVLRRVLGINSAHLKPSRGGSCRKSEIKSLCADIVRVPTGDLLPDMACNAKAPLQGCGYIALRQNNLLRDLISQLERQAFKEWKIIVRSNDRILQLPQWRDGLMPRRTLIEIGNELFQNTCEVPRLTIYRAQKSLSLRFRQFRN